MDNKETLTLMGNRMMFYSMIGFGIYSKYQGWESCANYFLAFGFILLAVLELVVLCTVISDEKKIQRKKSKKKAPLAATKKGA